MGFGRKPIPATGGEIPSGSARAASVLASRILAQLVQLPLPAWSARPRWRAPAALMALLAAAPGCERAPQAGPPAARAVVLITCDTLRADLLGAYGQTRPTTPGLDAFAREALLFESAYATAPWTQPALSSLHTGQMPEEIGAAPGNLRMMPTEVVTLAEVLRAHGIATAAVVSNNLLARPAERWGDVGLAQGFAHYDDRMLARELNRDMPERGAADTTDAAIAWLRSFQEKGAAQPFFLWVHYQDPHGPYTPPAEVARAFDGEHPPEPRLPLGKTMSGKGQIPRYQVLGDEQRPGVYSDRYAAEVHYFDAHLARLLEWLRQAGWYDEALIVFTSDHGESLGEGDHWFCHGEGLQREVVRVPLLVRFPGGALPGRSPTAPARDSGLAGHVDVWPTVLASLGVAVPPRRGHSLWREHPPERVLGHAFLPAPGKGTPLWAVTDGRYRVLWTTDATPQLFDHATDPGETRDLMGVRPDLARALLERWNAGGPATRVQGKDVDLDAATKRAMQQLGYIESQGH